MIAVFVSEQTRFPGRRAKQTRRDNSSWVTSRTRRLKHFKPFTVLCLEIAPQK